MLAYKFRSSSQIAFALDIVFKQRLHRSDWSTLNDPNEGTFLYSAFSPEQAAHSLRLRQITDGKKAYRVCSLSKRYERRLLWAHYASGFDGLAVEVDLPIPWHDRKIHEVIYDPLFPTVDLQSSVLPLDEALSILTRKHKEWEYEDEVRIIQQKEWYELRNPVKCIIVGHRFNEALFKALRIVCEQQEPIIILKRTRVEDAGVVAVDIL